MSSDDSQQRYDDILKRIANRKPFGQQSQGETTNSAYNLILDQLNALDQFTPFANHPYKAIMCYGPQVIQKSTWSGVMIWYHNKEYHGYQMLSILGVWVQSVDKDMLVTMGIRQLPYRASIFNPEGFYASIRRGFKLFYEDDGHPPSQGDTILFQHPYHQKERLTLRQTLSNQLQLWQTNIDSD